MILAAVSFFAVGDAFSKVVAERSGPVMALWGRALFFVVFVVPYFWSRRLPETFLGPNARLLAVRSLLPLVSGMTVIIAFMYLPLGQVTAIIYISPVISVALARIFLGEPVDLYRWLAVVIGFVGVLLVTQPGTDAFDWVMLLPLLGGVGLSFNHVITRHLSTRIPLSAAIVHMAITGLIVCTVLLPVYWRPLDAQGWLLVAATGLAQAVGQVLFLAAFARAPASRVAPFTYAQLVVAAICGFVAFGEVLSSITVAGAGLITAAGLLTLARRR